MRACGSERVSPRVKVAGNAGTRLNARLLQVSDVARALSRLNTHHDLLRVDRPERINHDLALDGLDWIDDNGDGAGVELLEGLHTSTCEREERLEGGRKAHLLRVDIDARQPASETGVRVVPSDDHLWSAYAKTVSFVSEREERKRRTVLSA